VLQCPPARLNCLAVVFVCSLFRRLRWPLALLQVRNLLIGQGALAANYLAELAQNADDASDGEEAQVRIVLNGEWLFVSNNGRKVTSLNLLGLSRFFVHAAGGVVELNEQTIGRFGIGSNPATASLPQSSCIHGTRQVILASVSPFAAREMLNRTRTANVLSV
jgi:hypothetical protein